ncbi:CueP family metal-binding protein [Aeromicrobium sp.]|uniref:CueP family metal-binding protein n=1 Tax=Aeromicrobium sp. TaxID=1871063 RepID=UPI0028AD1A27|nr:CueP family metal-binding protein [Aeromicrobium sp.]
MDDSTGDVLSDKDVKTLDNGFVGFWLPFDIEGAMTIRLGDKTGSVEFDTEADAPTCLTTLQMA